MIGPSSTSGPGASATVPLVWPLAILALVLVLTAAPTLTWMDTGELTTATAALGIGHPPGEPVYVQTGHLTLLLPLGSMPFRLGIFSALATLACLPLLLALLEALRVLLPLREDFRMDQRWMALGLTGMLLALPTWLQGVRVELYALQLLLALAILREGLLLETLRSQATPAAFLPPLLRLAFLLGLSLCVHPLLGVLLIPGLLVLIGWPGLKWLGLAVGAGVLGLAPLLFLPLRAHVEAGFRWGDPDTWAAFLEHITARSYSRSFVHTTSSHLWENLTRHALLAEAGFGWLLLCAALGGAVVLSKRPRVLLSLLLIGGMNPLGTLLQSLFDPDNPDALGYLALDSALLGLLAVLGLERACAWVLYQLSSYPAVRAGLVRRALAVLALGLCLTPGLRAFPLADHSHRVHHARYVQLLLESLPPGAALLTGADSTTLSAWYGQAITGRRPDVWVASAYLPLGGSPLAQHNGERLDARQWPDLLTGQPQRWPGDSLRRFVSWLGTRRPVHLSALDLPLELNDQLRPAPLTFALLKSEPQGSDLEAQPTLAFPPPTHPLDSSLSAFWRFWTEEVERLRHDPGWLTDRASRLYYSAHLEAVGDWLLEVGLLEQALRTYRLLERLDPDPHRMVRLKRFELEQRLTHLQSPRATSLEAQALAQVQTGVWQEAEKLFIQTSLAESDRPGENLLAIRSATEARLRRARGELSGLNRALQPCLTWPGELACREALRDLAALLPLVPGDPFQPVLEQLGQTDADLRATALKRLRLNAPGRSREPSAPFPPLAQTSALLEVELGWQAAARDHFDQALGHLHQAEALNRVSPAVLRLAGYLHRNGVR